MGGDSTRSGSSGSTIEKRLLAKGLAGSLSAMISPMDRLATGAINRNGLVLRGIPKK